jgi:hypothetical protein
MEEKENSDTPAVDEERWGREREEEREGKGERECYW